MNTTKLRTVSDLDSFIRAELAWRRQELFHIKQLLEGRWVDSSRQDALLRSGITMLYAHWEGFVKTCATAYICFVAMQRLTYAELAPNFLAVAYRAQLMGIAETKKAKLQNDFMQHLRERLTDRSQISWENAIDTEANLSSRVLRNIVDQLGLDYLPIYETRQNQIDEVLLRNRNFAAHGEHMLDFDLPGFQNLYKALVGVPDQLGMLEIFGNQISNAALLGTYKSVPAK